LGKKPKRHPNIGQHKVIIIGYLPVLTDGDGFIRGPYPKNDVFIFWMGLSQSVYDACVCAVDCAADVSGSTDVAESSCVCCTLISEQAEIT